MKKLIALSMLCFPVLASAAPSLLIDSKYAIPIDQEAYERVFLGCVSSFKPLKTETYEGLDDAIKMCDNAAQKIAYRGNYKINDGTYYVTAVPTVPDTKRNEK